MRRPDLPRWVLVSAVLILAVGVAAAAAGTIPITQNDDGLVLNKPGGPALNLTGNTDFYTTSGSVDASTIQYNTSAGNLTASSTADTSATIAASEITGPWTNITAVDASGADLTIDPADKASATVGGGVTALSYREAAGVGVSDGQVDFKYSASGSGTITLRNLPASDTFHAVTASGTDLGSVSTDASGTGTISTVSGTDVSVYLVDTDAPVIESASPSDGERTNQSSVTLSATVSDQDFADDAGDEVTIEFYLNGSLVDTQTITSNGTVSTSVQPTLGEDYTWHAEVSDRYGNTNSIAVRDIYVPAELRVYYETRPTTLVQGNNLSLQIRFFPLDGGQIRTRDVDDGVANLTGLPVDERFVVTVNANSANFTYRRIVVESLYETQRIYLLQDNQSSSQVVFELVDPTGEFPPEETVLFVEKPITINNSTSYQVIAGDTFGSTARFPVVLQERSRYRLRVQHDGRERVLGAYNVYGTATETLQIQRIEPRAENRQAGVVYGGVEQNATTTVLSVRFLGTNASEVTYYVRNQSGAVVVPNTTTTASSFAHMYQFNSSVHSGFNVQYSIDYQNGTTVNGSFNAGAVDGIVDRLPVDGQAVSIISWILILAAMGLVVMINVRLAPAVGTAVASALTIIGTVAIPAPVLGIAGVLSAITLFGGGR